MADFNAAGESKVFWVDAHPMAFDNNVTHKLIKLMRESDATKGLSEGMEAALKVNTSEDGYTYGLRPMFVRVVADEIGLVTKNHPAICDGIKLVDYWREAKGNVFLKTAYAGGTPTILLAVTSSSMVDSAATKAIFIKSIVMTISLEE